MKLLKKTFWYILAVVVIFPCIANGFPLNGSSSDLSSEESDEKGVSRSERVAEEDVEFHDDDEAEDQVVLTRLKRDFYDRDPWGRIPERQGNYYKRRYSKRPSRWNTRRFPKGRRKEHHNYRGPDYGDDFEETSHKLTNTGYVDTAAFDKQTPPKQNFVSARASGVAKTETSGSSD